MAFGNPIFRLATERGHSARYYSYFDEAKEVHGGEPLVILTFFTNPSIDKNGNSRVKCSLKVTRPDVKCPES